MAVEEDRATLVREVKSLDEILAKSALARGEGLITNAFTRALDEQNLGDAYAFHEFPEADRDAPTLAELNRLAEMMRGVARSRGLSWDGMERSAAGAREESRAEM